MVACRGSEIFLKCFDCSIIFSVRINSEVNNIKRLYWRRVLNTNNLWEPELTVFFTGHEIHFTYIRSPPESPWLLIKASDLYQYILYQIILAYLLFNIYCYYFTNIAYNKIQHVLNFIFTSSNTKPITILLLNKYIIQTCDYCKCLLLIEV